MCAVWHMTLNVAYMNSMCSENKAKTHGKLLMYVVLITSTWHYYLSPVKERIEKIVTKIDSEVHRNKKNSGYFNWTYNLGQKCWDNCWKQEYFSQIGGSCKIPSPLLPQSMLNKKFQPRATLYGGGGVWLKVLTRCLPTFKLNIRVLWIFSRGFVPDRLWVDFS